MLAKLSLRLYGLNRVGLDEDKSQGVPTFSSGEMPEELILGHGSKSGRLSEA